MSTAAIAANAYQQLARITDGVAGGAAAGLGAGPGAGQGALGGFGAMLQEAMGTIAKTGQASDLRSVEAVQGKADLVDVVTAVAESEAAIETLVSVRDRVIASYEEILRMPI